ncbi:MAG TPA: isocitrate lyase/phosphoenolpyruvate mutase family protein [Pseudonocardia sp.]|uniref:isocitrate lyase/PEP mutase family protein n=1 Tax=Pseudonocardia sp. TaxID=60912 RepID=UPI002ED90699
MTSLAERAERLRALHLPGRPVLLPNAWDPPSAAAVAEAGFPAVATGSAAVAASLGYPDGERIPAAEMFAAVARIVAAAGELPVTADLESGYQLEPKALVDELLGAGAVGCNLEDSDPATGRLVDAERHAERLAAVRAAAADAGVPVVINARVDVYLPKTGVAPADQLAEALARGRRYLAAGADCVYPILVAGEPNIAALVEGLGAVNVMFRPGGLTLPRLAELGVARVSWGSGIHTQVMAGLRTLLGELAKS